MSMSFKQYFRRKKVLELLALGYTADKIAKELSVTDRTIKRDKTFLRSHADLMKEHGEWMQRFFPEMGQSGAE